MNANEIQRTIHAHTRHLLSEIADFQHALMYSDNRYEIGRLRGKLLDRMDMISSQCAEYDLQVEQEEREHLFEGYVRDGWAVFDMDSDMMSRFIRYCMDKGFRITINDDRSGSTGGIRIDVVAVLPEPDIPEPQVGARAQLQRQSDGRWGF